MFAEEYSFEPQLFGFEPERVTFVKHGSRRSRRRLPIAQIRGLHEFKDPWLDPGIPPQWTLFLGWLRISCLHRAFKFEKSIILICNIYKMDVRRCGSKAWTSTS